MRPYLAICCLKLMCCLTLIGWQVAPASGQAPQDFTVESPTHGSKFTLSEAKGKIVVLHFLLKTECPFCLRYTHSYAQKSLSRKDIVHIFLKPDSEEEIKRWASHLDQSDLQDAPVIYRDSDAKIAKAFKIPDGYKFHGQSVHYPALVTLDDSGRELFRYVGKSNSDRLSYQDFEKRLSESHSPSSDFLPHHLLPLIHAAEVQRELKLSDGQVDQLESYFTRVDGPWFRSRITSPEAQATTLRELETNFWSYALSLLKPEQITRLKQLELQALGSRMFLREDIARQLKLTKAQNDKLLALVRTTESARKNLQTATMKKQPTQELEKSLAAASNTEQREFLEILTANQKQLLAPMIGSTFDTATLKRIYPMAPEFAPDTEWFNSSPLTLDSLRGKVVIVHFYAFQCHNCHANFAIYQRWHQKWKDKGVVVIGIQSPETERESDPQAVRQAAIDRKLDFPIIMDGQMKNWNAWANTLWPTVYVVDKRGYLRHWWQGELNWQGATGDKVIEDVVEAALAE